MISISSPGFCMTPFFEMLKAIAPHFDSWEIIAEGMHTMSEIQENIKEAKDSYDLQYSVHAPFSDLNIASLNPKIRESSIAQIEDSIRISSELDIRLVTIHPGYKSPLGAYFAGKIEETNKKSLKELDRAGEEHGVVLALENIPKMWISLCSDADEMKGLIEGTNLKICFDLGHAHISDAVKGFLDLKENIANLHLHDNHGDKDRHMILGEGNVPFTEILRALRGYEDIFVIESMNLEQGIESKKVLTELLKDL
ncbi:MAG: sugar phosphate isomerase/epimerase [Thermoplasmata archaeon]|nr:MAG: sugar phosphate isomerase/epimerase [Thermoplasmata archaeon]